MKVCAGENRSREIINPSPEVIERAIDELIPVKYHFVILEHDEPVQNCAYIQTRITLEDSTDIRYVLEARFIYGKQFEHYQKFTNDAEEIKKVFRMFALEEIPIIKGWADITADLLD